MHSIYALLEQARESPSYQVEFRFGGAVGPIAFSEFTRRVYGLPGKVIYPIGLALRTSARLEPYAPKNSIIVEEGFFKAIDKGNDSLMIDELGPESVAGPEYDQAEELFVIRKNLTDEPFRTRLFSVKKKPVQ